MMIAIQLKLSVLARLLIVSVSIVALFAVPILAAITPVSFTGFDGTGFQASPAAGQLDSDNWSVTGMSDGTVAFGGTGTTGDFARGASTGGVTTGGIYAFDVGGGNVALGVQPGGSDFTPGNLILKVTNTTGSAIADIYVTYKVCIFNDQGRSNSLNFSYSTDNVTYTSVAALDVTSGEAADASPAWSCQTKSTTISGVNLANNGDFYAMWTGDDVGGSGSRDEFAIDDIEVRANTPTAITLRGLSATSGGTALPVMGLALVGLLVGAVVVRRK